MMNGAITLMEPASGVTLCDRKRRHEHEVERRRDQRGYRTRVQVERISGERPPSANHPGPGYFPNVFLSKGSTSPLDAMGSRISVSP